MKPQLLKAFYVSITILLSTAFTLPTINLSDNKTKIDDKTYGKEYFPIDLKKTLIYDSSFGDLELKITKEKNAHLCSYYSDK